MSYSFQKMRLAKRRGSIAGGWGGGQGDVSAWMQQVLRGCNARTESIEQDQCLAGSGIGSDFVSNRPIGRIHYLPKQTFNLCFHLTRPRRAAPDGNLLAICILLKQLEQAVDIAKHPQVSDLLTLERKECSPLPLNRFSSRLITKELAPMDARKAHTCECLRTLDHEVKYVAAITRQGGVHKIDI